MDKSVIKRIKITYGIFTSLLLVGLLLIASCSLLLALSDNVAYADNGIVNDNLFIDNNFSSNSNNAWVLTGFNSYNFTSNGLVYSAPSWCAMEYKYNAFSLALNTTYTVSWCIDNYSYYSFTFTTPSVYFDGTGSNYSSNYYNTMFRVYMAQNTLIPTFDFLNNTSGTFRWVKLELGSSFTGYVSKEFENYGYNQGVSVGSNSTAFINSGYILDKTVLLSDLDNGSTFTINNINYRFQGYTVLDNYFQTNVINSWPLGSNGDTNHRYLGFLIADDLYKFSAIQISIIRDGSGYLYYSGEGLTPKVVDLSSLSPVSSYSFNYLGQSTFMDTYVIYASEFTNVYYLTYLDTSSGTAGDTLFFNTINIYSNLDNSSWYDRGIETGKTLGYSEGYNKGYQEGSNYSGIPFYNMFGAIFDVPVQTINGLLDFNILGVNMKGFILGLISLCIILFILKIVFK